MDTRSIYKLKQRKCFQKDPQWKMIYKKITDIEMERRQLR